MAQVEPYKKIHVSQDFITNDPHASLGCTGCHGGAEIIMDEEGKVASHIGEFISDPSADPVAGCGDSDCHPNIAAGYAYSLHNTLSGERRNVALREGVSSFDLCPTALQDGYNKECTACHATCGDCHISKPDNSGAGFINSDYGHIFTRVPSSTENCMACHGTRISFDYTGKNLSGEAHEVSGVYSNVGTYHNQPDVHYQNSMIGTHENECFNCHSMEEMHAGVDQANVMDVDRYHYDLAPQCTNCHDRAVNDVANIYHQTHSVGDTAPELACQVCHSQPYNNCTNCHVTGAWKLEGDTYEEDMFGFKIAKNSIQDNDRRSADYVLVRHIPIAPDTYALWGLSEPAGYTTRPTWKYATPHNILRWTPQTDTTGIDMTAYSEHCGDNCHVGTDNSGTVINRDLYLTTDFLQEMVDEQVILSDEKTANEPYVMDDVIEGRRK